MGVAGFEWVIQDCQVSPLACCSRDVYYIGCEQAHPKKGC